MGHTAPPTPVVGEKEGMKACQTLINRELCDEAETWGVYTMGDMLKWPLVKWYVSTDHGRFESRKAKGLKSDLSEPVPL